jgi:hypothetical protein
MNLKKDVVNFFETLVTTYHTRSGHDPEYRNTSVMTDTFISFLVHYKRQIIDSEAAIFEYVKYATIPTHDKTKANVRHFVHKLI